MPETETPAPKPMSEWLNALFISAPKHVWKTIERVLISMFTTRATVPLGLVLALCIIANKLGEKSLENVLLRLIDSAWFAALGWFMFLLSLGIGIWAFRWREKIYQRELDRIQGVKDKVVSGQLELKFPKANNNQS